MARATVFYNQSNWAADEADCFDYRVGNQILPSGSVVIGMITDDKGETLDPPFMLPAQRESFDRVCAEARAAIDSTIPVEFEFEEPETSAPMIGEDTPPMTGDVLADVRQNPFDSAQ